MAKQNWTGRQLTPLGWLAYHIKSAVIDPRSIELEWELRHHHRLKHKSSVTIRPKFHSSLFSYFSRVLEYGPIPRSGALQLFGQCVELFCQVGNCRYRYHIPRSSLIFIRGGKWEFDIFFIFVLFWRMCEKWGYEIDNHYMKTSFNYDVKLNWTFYTS